MLLIQVCEQGLPIGNYDKVSGWLEYLAQDTIFNKMLTLFTEAWSSNQDIDVLLVLGAVKCGLYSRNELTAKNCVQLLLKIIISVKRTT